VIVVVIGVAVVALVVIVVLARGRRTPDGVASFQRQIDALSPEARRPVVKRLEDVTKRDDSDAESSDREGDADGA
jgi:hypothetical protein